MYWPVGATRIYSSCRIQNQDVESDHDADSPTIDFNSIEAEAILENANRVREENNPKTGLTTPKPANSIVQPVEQDRQRQHENSWEASKDTLQNDTDRESLLSLNISRSGHIFAVITSVSLTIWQTKPTAILAVVLRSKKSLHTYGPNISLLIRPDSAIFVVLTTKGYLITYTLEANSDGRVYKTYFPKQSSNQTQLRNNFNTGRDLGLDHNLWGPGEGGGAREVSIRFRMVIQVDAGIQKAIALEDELLVATKEPAAVQCIRWIPDGTGNQTRTELFSKMEWLPQRTTVIDMIHDRPMNLSAWITIDGKAYAVHRLMDLQDSKTSNQLFQGYCFHTPKIDGEFATKAAINARFSLIAIGCEDGAVQVYTAKDYIGNIPSSHIHRPSVSIRISGSLTCLTYSPDGYCLFAGYENGWAMWSVFGKPGATSFSIDNSLSGEQKDKWLVGVKEAIWLGGGLEILMISHKDHRIWSLEMARSAITGCYGSANISRTLLQTNSTIALYTGNNLPDLSTISGDSSLWHISQVPSSYLIAQWPIRCSVISPDGKYIAVAGRRGLAHYSVASGRWKTFVDEKMENEFQVRGGMCWHQHVLVAAIEAGELFQLRLFSREADLSSPLVLHIETLPAPIVLIAPSGEDSLLVYTHENNLYHYVFTQESGNLKIIHVGQIAFNGIVRSPARVRGLSWILPDDEVFLDDPSQEVVSATVLFLVDGKLVMLQPSLDEDQKPKYDMRVIAHNVEYYTLTRDFSTLDAFICKSRSNTPLMHREFHNVDIHASRSLNDSLWIFEGNEIKVWIDVQDILCPLPSEPGISPQSIVSIPIDFYPLSILLEKGIVLGLEPEITQRRDLNFAFFKSITRTHPFIPQFLQYHLSRHDSVSALGLARRFQSLDYFSHSLEMLLHNVLDHEVDSPPSSGNSLLPGVVSLLSSFPQYLEIILQCTRKTEVRSWRTLFNYLPPAQELFEESLKRGLLKTAGGYLLILHTFQEMNTSSEQLICLLLRAKDEEDWSLCREIASFLFALDQTGATLKEAMEKMHHRS
ncbi:hypothetical protein K3495_g13115 [Podosphaera aphanis]|nr:hypothetical protein K3495_g13115 [Podosphaera aphanis]